MNFGQFFDLTERLDQLVADAKKGLVGVASPSGARVCMLPKQSGGLGVSREVPFTMHCLKRETTITPAGQSCLRS